MSNTTHSPTICRQESFESFRPQIVCSDIVASGTQESCKKKRSKVGHGTNTIAANSSSSSKPKPGRKPDPGAPKITRPCSECGKQFWSWKALFGHMRCHPERQWRGINPPPNLRRRTSPENPVEDVRAQMTAEDHEVASCLLMLANRSSPIDTHTRTHTHAHYITFDRGMPESASAVEEPLTDGDMDGPSGSNCRFECSSCKKVFGSHQALGGHRASHKNVKGCFALARYEKEEGEPEADHCNDTRRDAEEKGVEEEGMMLMVLGHKCSICLKVFSSGQALGGHKRCHWEKGDESPTQQSSNSYISREGWGLDLNLPAPVDNNNEEDSSSGSSELALDLRLGI